jgi:RHS repeat-associated protein
VRAFDYIYDANQQLLEVKRDGATLESYGYDPNANRTRRELGADAAEAAVYDARDRLVSRGSVEYHVDDDGFLVSRGSDTFTYGTRGELLTAHIGDQTITYSYDALGRQVARDLSTGAQPRVEYLYGDPADPLRVTAVRSGTQLTVLFHDEEGSLYAFERAGSRYYVASDHLGSPRLVATASGQVVRAIEYDAFGASRSDSDPGFFLPIGFAGGLSDPETGLVHFGFRDYEPASGRWTARDPVLFGGGQGNLYAYVGNSPVTLRDPSGLSCFGASVYNGWGGGAKICYDEGGLTVCDEIGFGKGVSVDLSLGGQQGDKLAIVGEAALECGPFAFGGGFEYNLLDRCGKPLTLTGKCQLGPFDPCGSKLSKPSFGDPHAECGGQGKLALEACARLSGPLF